MSRFIRHFPCPPACPVVALEIVTDTSDRLSFCMSPEGERDPNCEGISIALQNGRVSSKMYVRD